MLEVIVTTKLDKINVVFDINNLYAGILYNNYGEVVRKIMFIKNNNTAIDVFTDEEFILDTVSNCFVKDEVLLSSLIRYFFKKTQLNLAELYLVYKKFVNDTKFIDANLDYFDMKKREVGYKGKYIVIENEESINQERQLLYKKLIKIIDCKKRNSVVNYDRIKGK